MDRRFEKTLSQILSLVVLIVFVATLATMNVNIWAITYIWAISFILVWVLMLVYSLYILMQKNSFAFSIITAIITAIAFGLLSIPAIVVVSRFIPQLPSGLTFGLKPLDTNSQLILYTSLIAVYFFHTINAVKLRRHNDEYLKFDQEKTYEPITDEDELIEETPVIDQVEPDLTETLDERQIINEDVSEDLSLDKTSTNDISLNKELDQEMTIISSDDLEIGEKIVFESNVVTNEDYNIENIKLVEDLTEEDLESMKGMDNNG